MYLPCFTALAMGFACTFIRAKYYNREFIFLCFICAVYFFVDAGYLTVGTNYKTIVTLDPIGIASELCIIPAVTVYLFQQWQKRPPKPIAFISYLPAVIFGTMSLTFMFVAGRTAIFSLLQHIDINHEYPPDCNINAVRYYYISSVITEWVLSIEMVMGIMFASYMLLKARKNKDLDQTGYTRFSGLVRYSALAITICIGRVAIGRRFMLENQGFCCAVSFVLALSFVIFCRFHIATPDPAAMATLQAREQKKNRKALAEPEKAEDERKEEEEEYVDLVSPEIGINQDLRYRLQDKIEEEKAYLRPGLTIEELAAELGTNRTYISIIINKAFNKSFRELINERRISYAKEFMTANPQSKIEEIAEASGFSSGAQFCRKFKEIEGLTPNSWLRSGRD